MQKRITDMKQTPDSGKYLLLHQGDLQQFLLTKYDKGHGFGFLRTNIGNADIRRSEIIRNVEQDEAVLAHDWRDIPMREIKTGHYTLTLPIMEVGRFEAKAFFLPKGSDEPVWPEGENIVIKVEPSEYCCLNNIYTAFVRQFGDNIYFQHNADTRIRELENHGYSVIPKSGTFQDLIKHLDFILGKLRFRIIQLLPIHPIPTTYGRMGAFGSPFATLDFFDVDPALTEFDRKTTPMDQFTELVDEIHARSGKLFLDIPINHTGWASHLQVRHPEWFTRREDI